MRFDFAFLDSGTGGLPYLKFLKDKRPSASCVYVGDTKNFPYGEKTAEEITEKSCECVRRIIKEWNPKAIVVACNTISVTALSEFRRRFPSTLFVGTVPAIKPASLVSKKGRIGLLATNSTVNHPYTKKLISDFAKDCAVISRGDPKLIDFIENDFYGASEESRLSAVRPAVDFFKKNGCDAIVLACTHFLNMSDYIQAAAGTEIKVIDSREGVVNHALDVVKEMEGTQEEKSRLYVTGSVSSKDSPHFKDFCEKNGIIFGGKMDF